MWNGTKIHGMIPIQRNIKAESVPQDLLSSLVRLKLLLNVLNKCLILLLSYNLPIHCKQYNSIANFRLA